LLTLFKEIIAVLGRIIRNTFIQNEKLLIVEAGGQQGCRMNQCEEAK
jgi:hypothetical protein